MNIQRSLGSAYSGSGMSVASFDSLDGAGSGVACSSAEESVASAVVDTLLEPSLA